MQADLQTRIDELTGQISELVEENANLRLLDAVVRRNTALFEALLANNSEGIALTGPDRRVLRVVKALSGLAAGDLTGLLVDALAIPEDRDLVIDSFRQLLRRKCAKTRTEIRVPRADGSIARFSLTLTDMLDDSNVQCIVLNYADITVWGASVFGSSPWHCVEASRP
jgi:PAS domain S-box-containing protein